MPREAIEELPDREARTRRIPLRITILMLCCLAAIVAIYLPSLNYQFVLDDHSFTSHPTIQESGHILDYFTNSAWAQFTGGPSSFYRPIFLLWLRINFLLSGLSPWGWHLLSILKHLLAAALLAALVWKLLRDSAAALFAATLFALHPAQTESVSWVTVPDPLMAAGVIAALLCYLKYLDGSSKRQPAEPARSKKTRKASTSIRKNRDWPWLAASGIAYFLAILTKETAIILPLIIFVVRLVRAPIRKEIEIRSTSSAKTNRWLPALLQTVPFIVITGVYFLLRFAALGNLLGAATQRLPWRTVVLSWPAILWFYVKLMFWPRHSYAFADPILIDKFSAREVLLPLIGLACAGAILAIFFVWVRKKAAREFEPPSARGIDDALILGTLLLILPLLPALNLNALNPGDFLHGRYTYLPIAGLMLLLATAWRVSNRPRLVLLAPACAIAVAFAVLTVAQEKQWKDDATIFTIAHQLAPRNIPVARHLDDTHVQAALQLGEEGHCAEALPIFSQVIHDFPDDWFAWAGQGDCYVQLNDLSNAEHSLHRASDLAHNPQVTEHWQMLRTHMGLPNTP